MTEVSGAADGRHPPEPYCDRIRPPADTVRAMRPHFRALGITRVARQTGLDRIGIPCWAAFRPNAFTLANNQGKGLDDDAAMASAVMEAAEFCIAEQGASVVAQTTTDRLGQGRVLSLSRQLPIGRLVAGDIELPFAGGIDLLTGSETYVAHEAVGLGPSSGLLTQLARSTNGLASGNVESEAILHGLLELIERDGATQASLQPLRPLAPASLEDSAVNDLVARIDGADFDLWLFDQTSDIGVPVIKAVIGDRLSGYWQHFDLAAGYGAHPSAARAAIRAITEAAQTRVTNIAGSRDDFLPGEYRRRGEEMRRTTFGRPFGGDAWSGDPPGPARTSDSMLADVLGRLADAGIASVVKVAFPSEAYGVSVVKVFAPDLEDRSCNRNWRPGVRSLRTLLAAA